MAKIQRTIQYRYFEPRKSGLGSGPLAGALHKAMQKKRNGDVIGQLARARIVDLDQDGHNTLLNAIKDKKYFLGTTCPVP